MGGVLSYVYAVYVYGRYRINETVNCHRNLIGSVYDMFMHTFSMLLNQSW